MFQNIIEEDQSEDINSSKKNKFMNWKSLFSVYDIVLYALSIMASMVSFGGEFAPFGIAIFAAACSNQIPAVIIYICTCIGTFIGFGIKGFVSYLASSLLFILMTLIFRKKYEDKNRNEKQKLGIYVFISVIIVQVVKMFFGLFLVYDLLSGIMCAIISYIFYKIFSNSITVVKEYGIKVFTIEEVIGASLLVAIAIYSLHGLTVFGLSISNILSIMLVMFLGWKNGMLVGATSGITIGMVLAIVGSGNPILIAAYAISRNDSWIIK